MIHILYFRVSHECTPTCVLKTFNTVEGGGRTSSCEALGIAAAQRSCAPKNSLLQPIEIFGKIFDKYMLFL